MKRLEKRAIIKIICTSIVLILACISAYVFATQEVKIQISQTPNVDIILTKSKTQANVANFEEDLKAELIRQNIMTQADIDAGKLNIDAIETKNVESQETLKWTESKTSSIGTITPTNNGKNISMQGNTSNAGKQAMWIIPEGNEEQNFNFGYSINFGDSFNAAGMLVRVQQNANGYIEGYMISFNNSGAFNIGANAGLWHFIYNKNNYASFQRNTDIWLVQSLSIAQSGDLSVKVTDTEIRINGGGLTSEYVYTMPKGQTYGSGYGFFSDHYSHGCNNIGQFTLTNIDLKVEVTKKFTEVLQAPTWRNGSTRILINVEDEENEEFSDSSELTEVITKLMNNNVYYIGWGTSANNDQINNIIQQNNNNGIFIENSSSDAVEATANYLKKIVKGKVSNTIIAGEAVNVKITQPISGVVTTPTTQYPNGVWKVEHDYNYYENPQGQYPQDSMYSNDLINSFDNVGKYSIYCEGKLVTEVYAHRRPISSFNMNLSGQNLTLNSTSYDLDIEKTSSEYANQVANNGIKAEKWEYKKVGDSSWVEIPSTGIGQQVDVTLDANTDYYIKLTVTDYQGVQTEAIKNVTTGVTSAKPIAQFKVLEKEISIYDRLNIVDESYDPSGASLTYEWKVTKTNAGGVKTDVYTGSTPIVDFSTSANPAYGVGKYDIQLIVSKNVSGTVISSNAFKQTITVTDDTTAPIIIIDPTSKKTYNEDINIDVKILDNESGLKKYKYAFTTSEAPAQASDFTEVTINSGKIFNTTLTIPARDWDKKIYLHVIAENNSGIETEERIVGEYYIEPTYELIIQAVDSNTNATVKDVKYDVIGEYADGTTVEIAKNKTTDKNGKITIEKARLKDVKKIKIDNISAAVGYDVAPYKNVSIDTSAYSIVVDTTSSSSDVVTNLSNGNQTLTVKVPVERKKFDLKIVNKDAISSNLISNTEFVLKQGGIELTRGTTVNGEVTLTSVIGGVNTSKEYVLTQETVNSMYSNVGSINLKVTFDADGNVSKIEQKLFAANSNVTIPDTSKPEITVKNARIDNTSFSVSVNVKDIATKADLQDSEYQIEVDDGKGLQYTTASAKTDASGNLKIDGLYGKGLLKLTFKHINAPAGYAVEKLDRYITIERKDDETITYNMASMSGVFSKFDLATKTLYATLTNEEKQSTNAIKIRTMLSNSSLTKVDNIGLKVYNLYTGQVIGGGKTDSNGLLEITGVTTDAEGDVLYKIVPDDANIITSNIIFSISYDRNKKIIEANETSSDDKINIYKTEDNDADYYKYTANVDIKIKPSTFAGANKLVLNTISSLDNTGLANVQYKVKIVGSMVSIDTYKTDSNGKIEITLPNDDTIEVEIQQTDSINGYKIDSTVKTVKLTRNTDGDLVKTYLNNIDTLNVNVDSTGDVQVKDVLQSIEYTNVIFKMAATNKDGTLNLAGVEFEITEPSTNYKQTVVTDTNGYVAVKAPFSATEGKSYEYTITEKATVSPYELPSNPIKMEIRFDKTSGIVRYLGESYLQGNEILEQKLVNYDTTNNEVTVELKVTNYIDTNISASAGSVYDIDITKVDKDGNVVSGSKYDIEIRPYAEQSISSLNTVIDSRTEITDLILKKDKTTVILTEKEAAIGCNLDSDTKILTLTLDASGNIIYDPETTSTKNIEINIEVTTDASGNKRTIVKVKITAEDPTPIVVPGGSTSGGSTGGGSTGGGSTGGDTPAPAEPTVSFNIYNRRYGSWDYSYNYYKNEYWHYHTDICNCSSTYENKTINTTYTGAERFLRFFNIDGTSISNGFKLISALDIDIEARLVNGGVADTEIYETAKATLIDSPNDTDGTHKVALYKDYKNKTVEFTIKENVAELNYKRNSNDAKVIVEFDADGNVATGTIGAGLDMDEIAVGGISADGVATGIQTIKRYYSYYYRWFWYVEDQRIGYEYNTYDIGKYNSIGGNTLYVGLLNKELHNPLSVTVNLKDSDTDENLDGPISLTITDVTNSNKIVETKSTNVTNGKVTITMQDTYTNRELLFTLFQTSGATNGSKNYIDNSANQIQFKAKLDDEGNIIEFTEVSTPSNAICDGASNTDIEYTIYNDMKYNFAINLTKQDEAGAGLKGVRVKETTSIIDNATTGAMTQVFTGGSALTDNNGNVKIKIDLPETPTYNYYSKAIEIKLDEYYVPDNYIAQKDLKVRVLFDKSGKVKDASLVSGAGDKVLLITKQNNVSSTDVEKSSIDLTMVNKLIEDKPYIDIVNEDVDDENVKLEGTKYKVTVWDEDDYVKNTLVTNEIKYSAVTDTNGNTSILFDNAHALRTMIFQIQEIQSSNSYKKNDDIILKVVYDEEGKMVSLPQIINPQTLINAKGNTINVVTIVGNPVGSEQLQLKIVNELEPKFNININRKDSDGNILTGKSFKAVVKEDDGSGVETIVETRMSKVTSTGYTIGIKTDTTSKNLTFAIYEETGDEFTLRGTAKIEFDRYAKVKTADIEGKYIEESNSSANAGNDYMNLTIVAEIFRIKIKVEDTTLSGLDLSGYKFEVLNSKNERNDTTTGTNSTGSVINFSGEVYKGETITYAIKQEQSPINYNDVSAVSLTVEFDDNGDIASCTPATIPDVYDLITTVRDTSDKSNMEIKMYTTSALRNLVQVEVTDEADDTQKIGTAVYNVSIDGASKGLLAVADGDGEIDLGSYKNYKEKTVLFNIEQTNVDSTYMINDKPIQISVTYDDEGLITDARIIATNGYVEIDTANTIGTGTLTLKDANKKKTEMKIIAHNSESDTVLIDGATFKIEEVGKTTIYSDTKTTGTNGEATLYVGPYYNDLDVTYKISNSTMNREYDKVADAQFTVHYDSNGKIVSVNMSEDVKKYINITIPTTDTPDLEIKIKVRPLFTIGVDAVDKDSGTRLIGARYEISQVTNTTNKDTVITQTIGTVHAAIGKPEAGKAIEYQIVEKGAPLGYKEINKNNVIGKIKVTYDTDGQIVPGSQTVTAGYDYIDINSTSDKEAKFDLDIKVKYEEVEEFKVIIENYNILNNSQKIQADFNAYLTSGQSASMTTDSTDGIGVLNFGKLTKSNPILTISQSNVQGNYLTIGQIKIRLNIDVNGKITAITTLGGSGVATENVAYTIDSTGSYTIKITVKNNPLTTIKLRNISDGNSEDKLQSTHELSANNISTMQLVTTDGEATATLESVPKSQTIRYTLTQTSVDRGYKLNKNIVLVVHYDSNGIIDSAPYTLTGSSYADSSVVSVKSWNAYQVELEIKNKQIFEIYLKAEDAYDSSIPLTGVAVRIKETTYSNTQLTLTTDSTGVAYSPLGTTYAGNTLIYDIDVQNNLTGYDKDSRNISSLIRIPFDSNGNINASGISSSNSQVEVEYKTGLAIEIKVKYIPVIQMEVTRRNTATNAPITGRRMQITSTAMRNNVNQSTDGNGKISVTDAGRINVATPVVYNISENSLSGYNAIEALDPFTVTVMYDANGYISGYTSSLTENITLGGIGTRKLDIELGSGAKSSVGIVNSDSYIGTERITGTYEITSSKGEKITINAIKGTTSAIEKLGKYYPGEEIEYTIHQTTAQIGYQKINDVKFKVEYKADGTIGNVTSTNTDILTIGTTNQTASKTIANINLEIHSKPILMVKINAIDKQYNSGVEGLQFKIKDEKSGVETTLPYKTDDNGSVTIPVYEAYENTHVTYTVTQIETKGGYKAMSSFSVIVEYGAYGTIVETGTYVINTSDVTLTEQYSEKLYTNTKLRGIELNTKVESEMGIGIEKKDVNGNIIKGVEYTISSKDISTSDVNGITKATNDAGEIVQYFGNLPINKVMEYTISEVQAPAGYRKVEDTVIRVYFDNSGRVISYTPVKVPSNVNVEVATSDLLKMEATKEVVHIKLNIVNDDRVTFKIVNLQNNTKEPIKDSEITMSVEDVSGIIKNATVNTNIDGIATIENVDASGTIKFYFNQTNVPTGISRNTVNSGYISINKRTDVYQITFNDSTDNLEYEIDSETGIVTVYLYNDNNLTLNIIDVDAETFDPALNATHIVKAQYGEKTDDEDTILASTTNEISYNGGNEYTSIDGITTIDLGKTYDFAGKKVIYTITTPTSATGFNQIGKVRLVVEFDSKGNITSLNGISSRLLTGTGYTGLTMNAIIGYGNNDFYTIKVAKEDSNTGLRVNGAIFDINIENNSNNVESLTNLTTQDDVVGTHIVDSGVIDFKKLKYEGNVKLSITETAVPSGYKEDKLNSPIEVAFDVTLDKTDPDDILLKVENVDSNGVKVTYNKYTKEIEITITNDPVLYLNVDKVDESGNAILGMEFTVKIQEKGTANVEELGKFKTDDAGRIELKLDNKYADKSVLLMLEETKIYEYQAIDPIIIDAYINEQGKIQTIVMTSGEKNAEIIDSTENSMHIKVTNKLEEYVKPYSITITKVDENDHNIKLKDVLFQVKVVPEVGNAIYKTGKTDTNGKIVINNLVGSGTIKIDVIEALTPSGYEISANNGKYTYEVTKLNDSLQKVVSNNDDSLWNIDNNTKSIDITIENRLEKIGLAFEKVDENNEKIKIQGAEYKLTNTATGEEMLKESDNNGIVYFALDKVFSSSPIAYTLEETKAPSGYELDSTVRTIYVQSDTSTGNIKNIMESTGLQVMEQKEKYAKIKITDKQKDIGVPPYRIELINVDRDDTSIPIENAMFDINITQTIGASALAITDQSTDATGYIPTITPVNGAGDIRIDISNTLAGSGYEINNNTTYVELSRDTNSGTITITNAYGVGAVYDPATDTVRITFESKKEKNKYSLKINVMDNDTGNMITDTNAKYKVTINGYAISKNIDANGQIVLRGLDIPNVTDFVISIQEEQVPSGKNSIKDTQEVKVDVATIYGDKYVKDATVIAGSNLVKQTTSSTSLELCLLYAAASSSGDISTPLYLKSDTYRVSDDYVERVNSNTTVADFLANMESNGTMVVYDKNGNAVSNTSLVGTGMKIVATKGTEQIEKEISVIGDITGNGQVKTLDINKIKQHRIGTNILTGAYYLAADINDDGEIKTLDVNKAKQIYVSSTIN